MADNNKSNNTQKRGPGRPPGSKNKSGSSSASKSSSKSSSSRSNSAGAKQAASQEQARLDKIKSMQEQYDRERRNVDVIWSITLFAVGLFLFFTVVMDTTGAFGSGVHDICLGLFGLMAYVLPFFVLLFAVLLITRKMRHISGRTIVFTILIFINMCILNSYRFIDGIMPLFGFRDIAQYYRDSVNGISGGAIGMEIGSILVKLFGLPGLIIIALAVMLISIFLVFNTPISRFFDNMSNKHEQKKIFREMEEAETAKVQMAVAMTATPGADPETGIIPGGAGGGSAAADRYADKEEYSPGPVRSLWRSILSGITRLDDEPDEVPSQREQYRTLREEAALSSKKQARVEPLDAPQHRIENLTDESEIAYTRVLGKDTLIDLANAEAPGRVRTSAGAHDERPVVRDMNYDDTDDGNYGYPGRSGSQSRVVNGGAEEKHRGLAETSEYKGKPGKQYGLAGAEEFGHSGSYGLEGGSGRTQSSRGMQEPSRDVSSAAAGLAANMKSKDTTERGLEGGYEQANAHRKKSSGQAGNTGLGEDEQKAAAYSRRNKKGLDEEPQKKTDEENELAASFDAAEEDASYVLPPVSLLKKSTGSKQLMSDYQLEQKADLLEKTLNDFGVDAKVLTVTQGASVTRYEVQPATGVKVSSITRLADDIALNLRAKTIRIEAPIPGKAAVGIEVENDKPSPVLVRELIESEEFAEAKSKITFAVGKDISGNNIVADLKSMPHLLIAGATGSGKSVCINTIITSFLYKARPSELKLIMIDPKVVELANYNGIPHLLTPVVTDARKASRALAIAVEEMDKRYELFAKEGVKDLESYNELMRANHEYAMCKPQVVIIIDELADLMMAAPSEVENSICRLAQKARAAGMHLIVATQRPSVDVVTGLIKANIPSRIAFSVASQVDSRTILDMAGAEKLLGKGDMLFSPVGSSKPYRVQGPYISDSETDKVIKFVKKEGGSPAYDEEISSAIESGDKRGGSEPQDELTEDAIAFILKSKQASVSMLQRRFRIGYNRAARIIDEIEEKGIIGPSDGSRPRQVLVTEDEYYNGSQNAAAAQETIDEISPQEKAELESRLTGKPHMNLMSRPEPAAQEQPHQEPDQSEYGYEEYDQAPGYDEVVMDAPVSTGNPAVDYFNSLPESIRNSILNSDD